MSSVSSVGPLAFLFFRHPRLSCASCVSWAPLLLPAENSFSFLVIVPRPPPRPPPDLSLNFSPSHHRAPSPRLTIFLPPSFCQKIRPAPTQLLPIPVPILSQKNGVRKIKPSPAHPQAPAPPLAISRPPSSGFSVPSVSSVGSLASLFFLHPNLSCASCVSWAPLLLPAEKLVLIPRNRSSFSRSPPYRIAQIRPTPPPPFRH